jgi:hypothetical protein|tara:strand:+ start:3097 stop:3402 length:306 start_codon:yes stop_codon:yes gene_type:complete
MREVTEKASSGSGESKKEFEGVFNYPEDYSEAESLLGDESSVLAAINETLSRRYKAQLRGSGKSTKAQQLFEKMVGVMEAGGISREQAEAMATKSTGYSPS